MKRHNILQSAFVACTLLAVGAFSTGCTKVSDGFLSPTMQYSTHLFVAPQGQVAISNSLVADGSNIPLSVRLLHIYDSTGKVVDDIFLKNYPIAVWTKSYNPLTDTSFASITAKREIAQLPPISINATSGVITTNSATLFVPLGTYSLDLQVSNSAGIQELKNAINLEIQEAEPVQTADDGGIGSFSLSRLNANTPTGATNGTYFNGNFNPYVKYSVIRVSDSPNVMIVRITDRNGVVFNPRNGEVAKRPNSGLNPVPPFLQNLQDYASDTYMALDTAMFLKYPLVPFPISSLGNGFNMYYRIPSRFVHMDSTSNWTSNTAGTYYKGVTDSHYLGQFKDGLYDYSLRIPMRIQVPGSYLFQIQFLNIVHK